MNIKLSPAPLHGVVRAVSSKSQAHRLLIAAALSPEPSRVACRNVSEDIDATVRCLNALGARITYSDGVFDVGPITLPIDGHRALDCGESGSTLRFLLPVCCALGVETSFYMSGRLPSRPLSPLYEELISHGCALSARGHNPLHASGKLTGGRYMLPGNISSQFVSGLLMALPLTEEHSIIQISGEIESKPYIDMTLMVLEDSGITVRTSGHTLRLAGRQKYAAPPSAAVEGDWSNAAFWLCAGALGYDGITVTDLNLDSLQGDKVVLQLLEQFGAHISYTGGGVTVRREKLRGFEIDAADTPDLVPVLAAVAAVSQGRTVIYNAGRLRAKESNRLHSTADILTTLGADAAETSDGLIINGRERLGGGTVSSHGDHRIAMAAAVASAVCTDPVVITGAQAVNKSYPGFFRELSALGGAAAEVS